jgi:hypothetical protein
MGSLLFPKGQKAKKKRGEGDAARTLEGVARFTVHLTGQISRALNPQETPSILTAYRAIGDRFFYEGS